MKRAWKTAALVCLLLAFALTAAGCSQSNLSYYEQAQLYLGSGDLETAGMIFRQLGEYRDSADYALYCAALSALEEEEYDLARANFVLLDGFKSSGRYLQYLDAAELAAKGESEKALTAFETLGSFGDSRQQAERLREKIPEDKLAHARALMTAGRYEQAVAALQAMNGYGESEALIRECEAAMEKAAYDQAEALYASGQYEAALSAFEALGDTLDAAARTLACRSAMYTALEEDYQNASLSTVEELIARYEALEGYLDSEQRAASLERRFRIGLQLLKGKVGKPFVRFGSYPREENGLPGALTWQVIHLEGATATLLCTEVIDADHQAQSVELILTEKEAAALKESMLPTVSDLAGMELTCGASPYALAQGVPHETDGRSWWWLRDGSLVSAGGSVIKSAAEVCAGIRPMVRVSLEDALWTQGEGTAENPYQ